MRQTMTKPKNQIKVPEPTFDLTGFVIAYEGGELDEAAIIDGFQHLIDSGLAWQLQGHYGRTAKALIDAGYCTRG